MLDIIITTTSVLYPDFRPMLANMIIIPFLIQYALIFCTVCIFLPKTQNEVNFEILSKALAKTSEIIDQNGHVLKEKPYSEAWQVASEGRENFEAISKSLEPLSVSNNFLLAEFTYCHLGYSDLHVLLKALRRVLMHTGFFPLFYGIGSHKVGEKIEESKINVQNVIQTPRVSHDGHGSQSFLSLATLNSQNSKDTDTKQYPRSLTEKLYNSLHHHYNPVGILESLHYLRLESTINFTDKEVEFLSEIVVQLDIACSDLLQTTVRTLRKCAEYVDSVNSRRHFIFKSEEKPISKLEDLKKLSEDFRLQLEDFRLKRRLQLLEPLRKEENLVLLTQGDNLHRIMYRCFFFSFNCYLLANSVSDMLQQVCIIAFKRRKRRLWYPTRSLYKLKKKQEQPGSASQAQDLSDFQDPSASTRNYDQFLFFSELVQAEERDPDTLPPSSIWHLIGRKIYRGYSITQQMGAVFMVKSLLSTFVSVLPALFRNSSGFYFKNRGLWTTVLATVSVSPYSGSMIFGSVSRIVGTFFGAALGTCLWYMGNGNGTGNPYGLMAVMTFGFPLIYFIRINLV